MQTIHTESSLGCAQVINEHPALSPLFQIASQMTSVNTIPAETRKRMVDDLRAVAEVLERSPESIKGLVFIAAETAQSAENPEQTGIQSHTAVAGNVAFLAAAGIIMGPIGEESLQDVIQQTFARKVESELAELFGGAKQ